MSSFASVAGLPPLQHEITQPRSISEDLALGGGPQGIAPVVLSGLGLGEAYELAYDLYECALIETEGLLPTTAHVCLEPQWCAQCRVQCFLRDVLGAH